LTGIFRQFWSPAGYQIELHSFWSEGWFPSRIVQFLGGVAQLVAGPSPEKQPMRGMQQALMDRPSFGKEIIEACVLDKARHATVKGW